MNKLIFLMIPLMASCMSNNDGYTHVKRGYHRIIYTDLLDNKIERRIAIKRQNKIENTNVKLLTKQKIKKLPKLNEKKQENNIVYKTKNITQENIKQKEPIPKQFKKLVGENNNENVVPINNKEIETTKKHIDLKYTGWEPQRKKRSAFVENIFGK